MGGILGGGSSINFMMYTRAQGADFDSWNTPGWSAKEMLQMCNKFETYHPKGEGHDQSVHGHDGPINVSDGGFRGKSELQFKDTVQKMGYKFIEDLQDFEAVGGFSVRLWSIDLNSVDPSRAGDAMSALMEKDRMPHIDISTHCYKMDSTPTCTSCSTPR